MSAPLFKKILYATDLSVTAKKAAHYAISLAHEYEAALTVINVIPDLVEEMSAGMGYDLASHFSPEKLQSFYTQGLAESKKKVIQRIHTLCKEAGEDLNAFFSEPEVLIVVGHPVEQIINAAKEGHFDLIVLGTHGHGMIDDLLLGSVARGVVKLSPVPVLTVKLKS
jgi:nucleotide-binding universal stress UspA family protein